MRRSTSGWWTALFLLAGGGGLTSAAEPDLDLAAAEKMLKAADVGVDGPAVLAFLKSKTLSPEDEQRLQKLVRALGDDLFAVREQASADLVKAGRLALPYVKAAIGDGDAEVAKRARECLEEIEAAPHAALMTAAVRVGVERQPPGLAAALLNCLPWVDDEAGVEAIFAGLRRIGVGRDGAVDVAVVAAATDKHALRRAAAGHVLGIAEKESRRLAVKLLNDADARVRFHAAAALLRGRESEAPPALCALLAEGPLPLAWQAEDLLSRVGGDKGPTVSLGRGNDADRRKCRAAWEEWWRINRDKIDLTKINFDDPLLGLTMIAELDGSRGDGNGQVWECGPDGKARWELSKDVNRPIDAQALPGGRVLIAEHGGQRVTERDRDGKVLWEFRTESQPVSCQRLANGDTVIATYNQVLEVDRNGNVVINLRPATSIYNGCKLRNGNFLYVQSNNQIIEQEPSGKVVQTTTVANTGGWASVDKLANGNCLAALYSSNKVVEVEPGGKVVWEVAVKHPGHATRLSNGNTLTVSIEDKAIVEFDRDGKQVWKQITPGRPFHARRR
jgi:hypothetical protein